MRALTVQQPWAWAIFHGKTIENRTQQWTYRGSLAIHAGVRWSEHGARSSLVDKAFRDACASGQHTAHPDMWSARGAILGVVDLVDVHRACGCCGPWGESGIAYVEPGERAPRSVTHLVLENARLLAKPIPCKGALGLWTPPAAVMDQLQAVL